MKITVYKGKDKINKFYSLFKVHIIDTFTFIV